MPREKWIDWARDHAKPALAALLGNAFKLIKQDKECVFYFDHSKANLISMLENDHHRSALKSLMSKVLKANVKVSFSVSTDPTLEKARTEEKEAYNFVLADPSVKWALEHFKGEIVHLKQLGKDEPHD